MASQQLYPVADLHPSVQQAFRTLESNHPEEAARIRARYDVPLPEAQIPGFVAAVAMGAGARGIERVGAGPAGWAIVDSL